MAGKKLSFQDFLEANGVPLRELAPPIDRLLLRCGIISHPVAIRNIWLRAAWLSALYTGLSVGLWIFVVRVFLGFYLWTEMTPQGLFVCLVVLALFGPLVVLMGRTKMRKHEALVRAYFAQAGE